MDVKRLYWLDLFTGSSWSEFKAAGANVSGFSDHHWATLQQVKIGDYLLCYLTGVSSFIGVLEVISEPYRDQTPIWKDNIYPCRLRVKVVHSLEFDTSVQVHSLLPMMASTKDLAYMAWVGLFRRSLKKIEEADAKIILEEIERAEKYPVKHTVDKSRLMKRPKSISSSIGSVTIPQNGNVESNETPVSTQVEESNHTELQWLLLKLGSDMGLDIMVAQNDKSRRYRDQPFSSLKNFKTDLPVQFDDATRKTIQLIDVLWLNGRSIVAAFEIESTTSIYSGLLRMSDLIAMQPNLSIPLYLVAPSARRNKVIEEINRPTFSRLTPPMSSMCRYISFEVLKKEIQDIKFARHIKPDFLVELSESSELEDR